MKETKTPLEKAVLYVVLTVIAFIAVIINLRQVFIDRIIFRLCIIDSRTHIVQVGNVLLFPSVPTYSRRPFLSSDASVEAWR